MKSDMKMAKRSILSLLLIVLVAGTAHGMGKTFTAAPNTGLPAMTAGGMKKLQTWYHWKHWYDPWTWATVGGTWMFSDGIFKTGVANGGWWNSANALTTTADYERLTGDTSHLKLLRDAYYSRNSEDQKAYIGTNFVDDEGWWALGFIGSYDVTSLGQNDRLNMLARAQYIFDDMTKFWDNTCGGGIWWQKNPKSYKNAIANELFMSVAAHLYNRTGQAKYRDWLVAEMSWFFTQSGMYQPGTLIPDGLDSNCKVAQSTSDNWTYNQGVVLGALVEAAHAGIAMPDGGSTLDAAKQLAMTVIGSPVMTRNGVLVEKTEYYAIPCGASVDCPQFKGIFMRNLGELYRALPCNDPDRQPIGNFISTTANSILGVDTDGKTRKPGFGEVWAGPFSFDRVIDQARQSSALDALIAALTVRGCN